jgi:beta-galactosidase
MTADRQQISADGEDVAMFAVEVRDAQDRILPITDNEVQFKVSGAGKLIGTGNGDPTNQEPDKGTARRAFSGLCMAIVQSSKTAGNITVEATSPGLTSASVTVAANSVPLRPQAAPWEREVPSGAGVTGLWRPMPARGASSRLAALAGDVNSLFTFRQSGSDLTGTVEGAGTGGFFGGSDVPTPITDGKVDGDRVSFKVGNNTYSGTITADRMELQRTTDAAMQMPHPAEPAGPRPVVGPPPDGSDPSRNPAFRLPPVIPVVLHRVQR